MDADTSADRPLAAQPTWRERVRPPAPLWAGVELMLGAVVIAGWLAGIVPSDLLVWLFALAAVLLLWRGPGWRGVGLGWPPTAWRGVAAGMVVGIGYQFLSVYAIEPLIAFATSRPLPDVSAFRTVAGDPKQLAFWVAMSWTRAGFAEEVVYRGWVMARMAELGRFSTAAWAAGAIGSSLVFGAMHVYQGLSGVMATTLAGVAMAMVYLATGRNLWAAVVAHSIMDTTAFVMIYLDAYPGLQV